VELERGRSIAAPDAGLIGGLIEPELARSSASPEWLMARAAVSEVLARRDGGCMLSELSHLIAEVLEVSVERFRDKSWLLGALDSESLMDIVVAIERRFQVRFTELQLVELTCVADLMDLTAATAPCSAARPASVSGPHDAMDPAAFDW
jgi:acyl carrier protein